MTTTVTVDDSTVTVTVADSSQTVTVGNSAVTVDVVDGIQQIADALDTNFSSLADNDIIVWDSAASKFINLTRSTLDLASASTLATHLALTSRHIDWTATGAGTIHASNYTDTNTTYTNSSWDHDQLNNFVAGEHFLQSAISINENQISDLGSYLPLAGTADMTGQLGLGNDNINLTGTGATKFINFTNSSSAKLRIVDSAGNYYQFKPSNGNINLNGPTIITMKINGTTVLSLSSTQVNFTAGATFGNATAPIGSLYTQGEINFAAVGGTVNQIAYTTNVGARIGSDAAELWGRWGSTPRVQPSNIVNTSSASISELETEVNKLKQLFRDIGDMAAS